MGSEKWNRVSKYVPIKKTNRQLMSTLSRLPRLESKDSKFGSLIEKGIKRFNGVISRNRGRSLIGILVKYLGPVFDQLTSSKVSGISLFSFYCFRIYKHQGSRGLVLTLKSDFVLFQQAIAGYRISDSLSLGMRRRVSRSGLPRVIPKTHRRQILIHRRIDYIRL